jgi:hypothetical protein
MSRFFLEYLPLFFLALLPIFLGGLIAAFRSSIRSAKKKRTIVRTSIPKSAPSHAWGKGYHRTHLASTGRVQWNISRRQRENYWRREATTGMTLGKL